MSGPPTETHHLPLAIDRPIRIGRRIVVRWLGGLQVEVTAPLRMRVTAEKIRRKSS